MKQSQQFFLTKINSPIAFDQFVEGQSSSQLLIAHCEESERLELSNCDLHRSCTILIGPEGDFTEQEIALAKGKGAQPIALGDTRLRTETAGMFACAVWRHKMIENEA